MDNYSIEKITPTLSGSVLGDSGFESEKAFELGLLLYLDDEGLKTLKEKEMNAVNMMFQEKIELTSVFDFPILTEEINNPDHDFDSSACIDLDVDSDFVFNDTTSLEEYKSNLLYRVISECDGSIEDFFFDFTTAGLFEAVKKYSSILHQN